MSWLGQFIRVGHTVPRALVRLCTRRSDHPRASRRPGAIATAGVLEFSGNAASVAPATAVSVTLQLPGQHCQRQIPSATDDLPATPRPSFLGHATDAARVCGHH